VFLNNNDKSLPKNISVEIEIVYTKNVNEIRHVGTTTYNTNRNLYIVWNISIYTSTMHKVVHDIENHIKFNSFEYASKQKDI
jgi:hypothetical protein